MAKEIGMDAFLYLGRGWISLGIALPNPLIRLNQENFPINFPFPWFPRWKIWIFPFNPVRREGEATNPFPLNERAGSDPLF
ncbi:hypothetical protein CEXT_911 [Caerostris extrusa]|uniref:Uncharacterized protein n=1 Tax=Caerostris extrusa TaxID=172846 RepID=A0AAV4Y2E9_CAEEX|nr:hypothetical protein CEXT_911 [Caerostris extrusa]